MADYRQKDALWKIIPDVNNCCSWEQIQAAILMDIRDELKRMNGIFHCPNAIDIPNILRRIDRNTKKPRKKKVTL